MSQITTHVLDTSIGKPAKEIAVVLEQQDENGGWKEIAHGLTNDDGRIVDWLPKDKVLEQGHYRIVFETGPYFKRHGIKAFYPLVSIVFGLKDSEHYHVPLLLNPYGYSTYRGS